MVQAGDVSSEQRARSSLERPSVASMSEGEAAPGGAEAPATPTATAAHPATPRDASQVIATCYFTLLLLNILTSMQTTKLS